MAKKRIKTAALVAPKPRPGNPKLAIEPKPLRLDVKLVHSQHWPAAQAYRDRASKIVISDKASCEGALREVTDGKTLRKAILAGWKPIKQAIDRVKDAVLDLEREEIAAVDGGLNPLEQTCVDWKKADEARVEAEAAAIRIANELKARADRERELKEQEDAAVALEASSPNLSARELWFVEETFRQSIDLDSRAAVDMAAMSAICKQAGYADPRKQAERLATSEKIREAVAIKHEVKAKNDQAAALREQPIHVPAPNVESQVAKTAETHFTKTYTLGGVVDLEKFIAAYRAGELDDEAMIPNEVFLRREAKNLEAKFEQTYPGTRVKILEGVAG